MSWAFKGRSGLLCILLERRWDRENGKLIWFQKTKKWPFQCKTRSWSPFSWKENWGGPRWIALGTLGKPEALCPVSRAWRRCFPFESAALPWIILRAPSLPFYPSPVHTHKQLPTMVLMCGLQREFHLCGWSFYAHCFRSELFVQIQPSQPFCLPWHPYYCLLLTKCISNCPVTVYASPRSHGLLHCYWSRPPQVRHDHCYFLHLNPCALRRHGPESWWRWQEKWTSAIT